MMHLLAQDYNKIRRPVMRAAQLLLGRGKRELNDIATDEPQVIITYCMHLINDEVHYRNNFNREKIACFASDALARSEMLIINGATLMPLYKTHDRLVRRLLTTSSG